VYFVFIRISEKQYVDFIWIAEQNIGYPARLRKTAKIIWNFFDRKKSYFLQTGDELETFTYMNKGRALTEEGSLREHRRKGACPLINIGKREGISMLQA